MAERTRSNTGIGNRGLWPVAIALLLFGSLWLTFGLAGPVAAGGPWYVATGGDDNNDCLSPAAPCATVQGAFDKADSGDTIHIAPGVYSTNLSYSSKDMSYIGAGPDQTILDGGGADQVIRASSADTVISGMTIRNGYTDGTSGAGVESGGSLLMSDVVLRDNVADDGLGGGLWAGGAITLTNVLATHNTANHHGSGIIASSYFGEGTAVLENVAVVGNTTTGSGGGALMVRGIDAWITNTTVSNNTGSGLSSGLTAYITMTHSTVAANSGPGFEFSNASGWIQNSIIAGNNNGGIECDIAQTGWVGSLGGNIEDGDSCGFDQASDQVNVDPLLEPLADNGGDTPTHALAPGSPALDAALDAGCAATDQRGVARPQEGDGVPPADCDSGAFEYAEIAVSGVSIDAPASAVVDTNVTIEAAISPRTATQPVTYTWTAEGQTAVTHSSGVTDSVTFTWNSTGAKTVNVTADNGLGQSSDSVQINIQEGTQGVTGVTIGGPTAGNAGETITFTADVSPTDATLPITYTWQIDGQPPVTHVGGLSHQVALSWPDAGSYTLVVTATNPVSGVSDSHTVALTAWYVNAEEGDDGNDCQTPATACQTIQSTLDRAPAGAILQIAPGTYSETVHITQTADLIGAGAGQTLLTTGAGPVLTLDDDAEGRFEARLEGVTVRDGPEVGIRNEENLIVTNSVIENNGDSGIINYGILEVRESTIRDNMAGNGAALISFSGAVTLNAVTVSDNTGSTIIHTQGNGGNTTLINVTLSNNVTGEGTGSAVSSASNATVAILNSTIVNNSGGGIANHATTTMQNTIVANHDGDNCWSAVTSLGHNLEDENTCDLNESGDQWNTSPMLGPLADNGGGTLTHALNPGSPAIDAGDDAACPATDQRGETRPLDGDDSGTAVCDIGAVEVIFGEADHIVFLPAVVR